MIWMFLDVFQSCGKTQITILMVKTSEFLDRHLELADAAAIGGFGTGGAGCHPR